MREGSSSKKDKMDMDKSEEFKCYHKNCDFSTEDEREYRQHGAQKHTKNPLLYPFKGRDRKVRFDTAR
jgi:hypothetical protein